MCQNVVDNVVKGVVDLENDNIAQHTRSKKLPKDKGTQKPTSKGHLGVGVPWGTKLTSQQLFRG